MRRRRGLLSGCLAITAAMLVWACGKSPTAPSTVTGYLAVVAALGPTNVTASSAAGAPPAATTGPTVTASGSTDASRGGSNIVSLQASAAFQTVFVTAGASGSSDNGSVVSVLASAALETLVVTARAATDGFFRIDLPSPSTSASIGLTYADSVPNNGFDLRFQVAGADGATGPSVTLHKSVSDRKVELVGQVFETQIGATFISPVAGAAVSTSLDSRTTTTDANGTFDLVTNQSTSAFKDGCYTITIVKAGLPTYSVLGRWGASGNFQKYTLVAQPGLQQVPFFVGQC